MKEIIVYISLLLILATSNVTSQTNNPGPYCVGGAGTGNCNQPGVSNATGNTINDFIDDFTTCGANGDITNVGSGCNALQNNYIYYSGTHSLVVAPGQFISCTLRSGLQFAQGFAIFIDWNQNNIFDIPAERVAATNNAPIAGTLVNLSFTIPAGQPLGTYRMRVRSIFAQAGTAILPCGMQTYSETEDYDVIVVAQNNSGVLTATLSSNSPICSGQTLSLSAATTPTTPTVLWSGPNSFTSALHNPVLPGASASLSGVYTVTLGSGNCPYVGTVGVSVAPNANFSLSPVSPTICQGGSFNGIIALNSNPALYTFSWSAAAAGSTIFNPHLQNTIITPPMVPVGVPVATAIYSAVVTPTINASCAITRTLEVTINNPLTPSINPTPNLCDIFNTVTLTAVPGGGTWSANPAVSANGAFNPQLASIGINTVQYSVNAGNCIVSNTGTLLVSKFHTPALTNSISLRCVQDPPFDLMNIVQDTLTGYWSGTQVTNNFFHASGLATGNYSLTHHTFSTPIASVCPATTVLVVPVFNPPIPVIAPIAPLCDISTTVALTANPPNGVWSGNAGVSANGIRTPSLNLIGTNTVTYTAGQGTCVASASKTFHLSKFNTAAFKGTVPHLCENSAPFNMMSIVQNTNGSWSGFNVSPINVFDPSGLQTNTYNLTYINRSAPNTTLCPDMSTVSVSVLNPPIPSITSIGPLCSAHGSVQLVATPANGIWTSTSYLTANGVFTPSLSPTGDNFVQYIVGTSTCNAQQTSVIKVEAFVPASITSGIDDQCNTNPPINLSPFTLNNSGYWSGTGIVGSNFNPALSGSGNFILTYKTASSPSGLCPAQSTVAIQVFSLTPPSIIETEPLCNTSLPIQLKASPVGGFFTGGKEGAISISGIFNPANGLIGDNYINYTISVGPCKAHASTKVVVEEFISASFAKMLSPAYCVNQKPFNLNSFVKNPGGSWSGSGVIGSMFHPSLANIGDNNIITYETHSSPSASLCPDKSSVHVSIKDIPVVQALSDKYDGCAPLEITLNTPNVNQGKGVWNITEGSEHHGLSVHHLFPSPGTYSVLFTYSINDVEGCSTQVTLPKPVVVYEAPKADFSVSPNEITIADPVVQLTNSSTVITDNKYVWNIQGQRDVYDLHPEIRFTQPGNYRVTLTATSIHNCKSETTRIIDVKNEFNIHIPNSFTPNFDGLNDVFIPVYTDYGIDTKAYKMEIFDRWGHPLFQTENITEGWDGRFQGETVKEGTYVYRIYYKDFSGKAYNKTGHINLLAN